MRRRIGTILLLAGSAAIVWCLTVLATAALHQWCENRRLERRFPAAAVTARVRPKLHDVIGRLDIPRLGVSTIVLEGDDGTALRLGAGHVPWTALPGQAGNIGIAAHRDTFFRPLRAIAPNDRITLTTPHGKYEYSVDVTEVVPPDAVSVLKASSHAELTLVTCYPFYYVGSAPLRFVVHAKLITEPSRAAHAHLPS